MHLATFALRDIANNTANPYDRVVFGFARIEVVFVEAPFSRMGRTLELDRSLENGLPRFDHLAETREDASRNLWEYVLDPLAKMFLHGGSMEPSEPLVHADESQFAVDIAEADGRV